MLYKIKPLAELGAVRSINQIRRRRAGGGHGAEESYQDTLHARYAQEVACFACFVPSHPFRSSKGRGGLVSFPTVDTGEDIFSRLAFIKKTLFFPFPFRARGLGCLRSPFLYSNFTKAEETEAFLGGQKRHCLHNFVTIPSNFPIIRSQKKS